MTLASEFGLNPDCMIQIMIVELFLRFWLLKSQNIVVVVYLNHYALMIFRKPRFKDWNVRIRFKNR